MAMMSRTQIGMRATGTTVNVPDDGVAKLMYYLNCICTVINLGDDPEINRFKDYRSYNTLSRADRSKLIALCLLLKPDVLLNKCIFQSDAMCGNSSNEFYELEAVRNRLLLTGSVMIGGRQKRVTKIMTFKMSWLENNWSNPIVSLLAKEEREERRRRRESSCVLQ